MQFKMIRMNEVSNNQMEAQVILPAGIYPVKITEKYDKESKNHDPMVSIKLEVTGGEFKGQAITDNIILSTNPESPGWRIRWRAYQFLKAIGEPCHGDDFEGDSGDWLFKKCQIKVANEEQTFTGRDGKEVTVTKATVKEYAPALIEAGNGKNAFAEAAEDDSDIPF